MITVNKVLTVNKATVTLDEQTVKELVKAIEEAKQTLRFTNDPMPYGDMSENDYIRHKAHRGDILVKSPHSGIAFSISLEIGGNISESAGYELVVPGIKNLYDATLKETRGK